MECVSTRKQITYKLIMAEWHIYVPVCCAMIDSHNGLSPVYIDRCQTITWTKYWLVNWILNNTLQCNFNRNPHVSIKQWIYNVVCNMTTIFYYICTQSWTIRKLGQVIFGLKNAVPWYAIRDGHMTWSRDGHLAKVLDYSRLNIYTTKKELCCHGDLDNSYPRQSTQNNPYAKQLEPRTTRSPDDLYLRQLVPKITCTQYNSYPGNKIITEYFENVFKQDSVTDVPDIKPQKLKNL